MLRCIIGYLAAVLFIYVITFKKLNKLFGKIKMKKLLKLHSLIGLLMIILTIVHVVMTGHFLTLSLGTLSLSLLIVIFITGMIISHFKTKNRKIFVYLHIGLSLLTLLCIVFHIIENVLLG